MFIHGTMDEPPAAVVEAVRLRPRGRQALCARQGTAAPGESLASWRVAGELASRSLVPGELSDRIPAKIIARSWRLGLSRARYTFVPPWLKAAWIDPRNTLSVTYVVFRDNFQKS